MGTPFTAEQIRFLDKNYGRKSRDSDAVRDFRKEVSKWAEDVSNDDRNQQTTLNSLYGAIKLKLGIRSMNSLDDDMLPTARSVFEQYKRLVE
jgi:hypothetical protein